MTVYTEVTDKREIMANQVLAKGHATMRELLTVSFGEWPPKGLDVDPNIKHGQTIKLVEIKSDDFMGQATAPQVTNEGRWIKLNPVLISQLGAVYSTMGHEMVHVLQGDYSFRLEKDFFGKLKGIFKGQSVPSEDVMAKITERKENPLSAQYNALAIPRGKRMIHYVHHSSLRRGSEVQARFHQIMIDGYPNWGRMPATTDEFFAVMKGVGFDLPEKITARLNSLGADHPAQTFLKTSQADINPAAIKARNNIQTVLTSLTPDSQNDFWNDAALEIYADLIEMYGDKHGRQRFGLGKNPKADIPMSRYPGQNTPRP